jgi:hypothetical protein
MDNRAVESYTVWRCIGCGRIEGPAPCIGICEDRPVELVDAVEYQKLAADYRALRELVLRLAGTKPREGRWEEGYRALQARANELLETLERR